VLFRSAAQKVVDAYTHSVQVGDKFFTVGDWPTAWYIFAAYALVIAVLFALLFKEKKTVK
jgi:hypothetical protein